MKRHLIATSLAIATLVPSIARAQFAVIDASNLTQAIKQVDAWKRQYDQMAQELKQMQAQQAAMTGSRNLGNIYTDPLLLATVPANAAQTFAAIQQSGIAGMTPAATGLRNATKVYNCENRKGIDLTTCQAFLNNNSQTQAYQQNTMLLLNQRMAQIQRLQAQINTTNDPKSIAELQARLATETAQVNNDANRIAVMRGMSESADRAAQQALKERELRTLSLKSDGSDTFVYRPYNRH